MSMFARILVAVDGSARGAETVQVARHLAERTGARLVLLTVESMDTTQQRIASDDVALGDQAGSLRALGLDAQHLIQFGRPADAIETIASTQQVNLIVMAPQHRNGLAGIGHRSVTSAMLSRAPAPLLILPADVSAPTFVDQLTAPGSPVVVPLDGSALAERALPTAVAFAAEYRQPLLLVRVIPAQPPSGSEQEGVRQYLDYVRQRVVGEAPVNTAAVALVGMPADEILWCAEGRTASLIVMSTHGRGGIGRAFTGSVATTIMHRARVPLVIVPPSAEVQRPPTLAAGLAGGRV